MFFRKMKIITLGVVHIYRIEICIQRILELALLCKLVPDELKIASSLSVFKPMSKTWTTDNCPYRPLLRILVLLKAVQISKGIHVS